jgi:HK97 family phage major capsid protein
MHSVDPAYRAAPGAAFMANDAQIGYVRKLNFGSANVPVWEPAVQQGEPDRIFGFPVVPNNDMSAAVTTGIKVLAFGDFNTYMVREVGSPVFVRLNELYALNGQVAFLAFERADGRNLDSKAIKWLNLA